MPQRRLAALSDRTRPVVGLVVEALGNRGCRPRRLVDQKVNDAEFRHVLVGLVEFHAQGVRVRILIFDTGPQFLDFAPERIGPVVGSDGRSRRGDWRHKQTTDRDGRE